MSKSYVFYIKLEQSNTSLFMAGKRGLLQQNACLVVGPITVGGFAFLFNCTPVGRTSDSMTVPT